MTFTSVVDVPKPGFIPAKQSARRIVRKGEPSKALVLGDDVLISTLKPGEVPVHAQAVSSKVFVSSLVSSRRKRIR